MVDLRDGNSRAYDELGLETPFADAQPWGKSNAEAEHFAFDESPFSEPLREGEGEGEEAEALAWLDLEAEEEAEDEGEWLNGEQRCSDCAARAGNEAEQEAEDEEGEDLSAAGACVARMKFEFQTQNKLHRNDGKASSQLKRKYGPDDFLTQQDGARLESESDANGVVEFETEWFRKWPKLEAAIKAAVKMTDDMSAASASRFDASRKAFPFDVAHLRKATAAERAQGYWNRRPGKEGSREKPLGATEELEVEIVDSSWTADIQSSEGMALEHYESLLTQHESPTLVTDTISHADALLKIANAGNSAAKNGKLRNFLLIVTNYVLRGQRVSVKGTYSKANFLLMNRTNFASIYSKLLSSAERQMFAALVTKKLILKELGLTASTRFFKDGYGEKTHFDGPTVNSWLQGIVGGKDLLAAGQSPGLSASMGRYKVETLATQKDRWLVKFEVRGTVMGRTKESKDWLSYSQTLFDLACKREVSAVELLIKQGIADEAALTSFVFYARHAELQGRRIRRSEASLAEEWKDIISSVIQPLLAKPTPELPNYGSTSETWISGEDEAELYASDWEETESDETFEAFECEELDEALFENECAEATSEFGLEAEDEWFDAGELEWDSLDTESFDGAVSTLEATPSPTQIVHDFVASREADLTIEQTEFDDETDAGLRAKSKILTLLPHYVEVSGGDAALTPAKMDPGFYAGATNYRSADDVPPCTAPLQQCLCAVMKNPKFANINVALVDLTKNVQKPEFAGHKHKEQVFVASVAKIAALAAAFQLQHDLHVAAKALKLASQADLFSKMRDGWAATQAVGSKTQTPFTARIKLQGNRVLVDRNSIALSMSAFRSPKLETIFTMAGTGGVVTSDFNRTNQSLSAQDALVDDLHLRKAGASKRLLALGFFERLGIAVGGGHASNAAVASVIHDVGYHYVASFLLQSGFYDPARGGGLWLGADYQNRKWAWRGAPAGGPAQSATAGSLATFMTLLAQERLVSPGASRNMTKMLMKAPVRSVPGSTSWFRDFLDRQDRPVKTVVNKLGLSKGTDEAAVIARDVVFQRNGTVSRKAIHYVAVFLRAPNDANVMASLMLELDNCILANNGISVSQLVTATRSP
jgi:hypothetical protein